MEGLNPLLLTSNFVVLPDATCRPREVGHPVQLETYEINISLPSYASSMTMLRSCVDASC